MIGEYKIIQIIIMCIIGILSIQDIKDKEISFEIILATYFLEVFTYIYMLVQHKEIKFYDIFIACLLSLFLYIVSKVTKEALGVGDVLVFLILSIAYGFNNLIYFFMSSLVLVFIVAICLCIYSIVRYRRLSEYEIAFIPFVLISYLIFLYQNF